tara:strand:+ start:1108 stop:1440 length:333 start_codon:yes stop_codon:yes gene_type:complete
MIEEKQLRSTRQRALLAGLPCRNRYKMRSISLRNQKPQKLNICACAIEIFNKWRVAEIVRGGIAACLPVENKVSAKWQRQTSLQRKTFLFPSPSLISSNIPNMIKVLLVR